MLYWGTMPRHPTDNEEIEGRDGATGDTRQMPVVDGPAGEPAGKKVIDPPRVETPKGKATAPAENGAAEGEVTQETVPMPLASWTGTQVQVPAPVQAPDKPPPWRRRAAAGDRSPLTRPVEVGERPGLLTTELRRAMPAWALPLLTFQPFSVWLGARIGLTLLAILAGLMLPGLPPKGTANWYDSPGGPPLTGLVDRLAGVWTRWDGQWYLKIATEGYQPDDGSAAFFPLYPWILRATGWLAGERFIWAGILISGLFFLAAMLLLHRLVRLDFHPEDAHRTTFYLAAFPMAFFFWAVYSESLFLLLAVATLLAARTHRWWVASIAISLAVWTRSFGLLLLLPLAWELWKAYHPPMPKEMDVMPPARPSALSVFSLVLPVLSLVGFLMFAALRFGDALAPITAQTGWNRHFSWPWETIADGWTEATSMPFQFQPENQSWTYFASLVLALVLGVLALRWLRGSYSIYLWSGILFPLFSATPHNPLLSYPRFLIVLFPMFIVLALIGRNRYAHQLILWPSILLLALFTIRFANWYWVA
ncbi:MAG TPA: mannosyltransferase family protein [Chloroflexia bacterium]|nr:mannosyltransferase family protein [Chloroflexia bacterium]